MTALSVKSVRARGRVGCVCRIAAAATAAAAAVWVAGALAMHIVATGAGRGGVAEGGTELES